MNRIVEGGGVAGAGRSREVSPALLSRAAAGDRDAQQSLLTSQVGPMRRIIRRLVSSEDDAEDLLQIACVELLRSLSRFRGEASLAYWADRIATRVVYKHYRSTRRRRARITLRMEPEQYRRSEHECRDVEWREGVRSARQLVDRLKPERRIIFLLVAVEGRSLQEAALMLGLSLSAAKSRYLRARRDVDRWLADEPSLLELLKGDGGAS